MASPPIDVGVVVLNHGRAEDTAACVASLHAAARPLRVVVVDNGSDAGSVDRLRGLEGIELVESDRNLGFGAGCNLGLRRLLDDPGDLRYAWVLNNDTTVDVAAPDELVRFADADPQLGAVSAVLYRADRPEEVLTWGGGSVGRRTGLTRDALGPNDPLDYLTGAALLLRLSAIREVGLFDERYFFTWEDIDLCARLEAAGWGLGVADHAKVWHAWGATGTHLSDFRVREHAAGAVLYLRGRSAAPWATSLPILGYYAYRAVRGRAPGILRAAWRGWRDGWRR